LLVVVALVLLAAPPTLQAQAKGDKKACAAAFVEAQKLRKSGSLLKARAALVTCAQNVCPEVVRDKCVAWLPEVEAELPSVILVAKGSDGSDLTDVEVQIDDESETRRIDGQPIPLDPGEHRFVFRLGEKHEELTVVVVARQKDRPVEATFQVAGKPKSEPTTPTPPRQNAKRGLPVSVYVLGGLGVVALGSFGYFGVTAIQDKNQLEDDCAPACSQDDKKSVDRKLLIADISLGVAVISLGAATWIALSSGKSQAEVSVSATPLPGGGRGAVRVSF
jgi:hypothetical protein